MTDTAIAIVIAALALCGSVYLGAVFERAGMFDWWHGE